MSIDLEWVKQQFAKAKVTQAVGTSVLRLLEVWNTMNHTDKTAQETLDVFVKVAMGHALVPEETDNLSGVWVPAQPGQIRMADIVRVKADAYTGDIGQIHNGRIGKVVGVRYGDVIIKTIDDRPVLTGAHHSPHNLEKLVKR